MTATVTFSLEIELGWSLGRTGKIDNLSLGRQKETKYLNNLISVCDELEIPFTFNIVGHLFHQECSGNHQGPHKSGWFDCDPGGSIKTDPYYYAPDLVDAIVGSTIEHEIATHTYSHVLFNDCKSEVIEWELLKAKAVHETAGQSVPTSLVPPQHNKVPYEILKEVGISTIRIPYDQRSDAQSSKSRAARLKEILFGTPPLLDPETKEGIIITYSSRYPSIAAPFLPSNHKKTHPIFRPIPVTVRQRLHRRNLMQSLKKAKETNSHIHYWAHLFDIANEYQWPQIKTFLNQLATDRERGVVEVVTMSDLHKFTDNKPNGVVNYGER